MLATARKRWPDPSVGGGRRTPTQGRASMAGRGRVQARHDGEQQQRKGTATLNQRANSNNEQRQEEQGRARTELGERRASAERRLGTSAPDCWTERAAPDLSTIAARQAGPDGGRGWGKHRGGRRGRAARLGGAEQVKRRAAPGKSSRQRWRSSWDGGEAPRLWSELEKSGSVPWATRKRRPSEHQRSRAVRETKAMQRLIKMPGR